MNITSEKIDELNSSIKLKIEKTDYDERVNNVLKDYRKKANINGFRPGKVPMGMINKMYRIPVMVDEINKLISENLSKYITDEKLNILGEPLPSEKEKPEINWETDSEFEFTYNIGLAPELEIKFTKKDKVPQYEITIDDKTRDEFIKGYTSRYGENKPVESTEEGSEVISCDLKQADNDGKPVEEGIQVEDVKISIAMVKDEAIKPSFLSRKIGDSFTFDIKKAFPNDTEIASLLKINKEEVETIQPNFLLELKEITKFVNAEVNQEFYDKAFGEGTIKSDEEFKAKIDEEINATFSRESDYRFGIDAKEMLIKKVPMDLPVEFLKRWMKATSKEEVADEQIEAEFPEFEKDLKWQLIKNTIAKDKEISLTEEDILEQAKDFARAQYMQYGMMNIPDEYLVNYAKQIIQNENDRRRLAERELENKVVASIREDIKIDDKKISKDDFVKLFE